MYTPRVHYSKSQMIQFYIRDLVADVRCAEGRNRKMPGMSQYAQDCRAKIADLFKRRHGLQVSRYGVPQ